MTGRTLQTESRRTESGSSWLGVTPTAARSEHDTGVLRARLRLMWGLFSVLGAGSLLAFAAAAVLGGGYSLAEHFTRPGQQGHIGAAAVALVLLALVHYGPRRVGFYRAVDSAGTVAVCVALSSMARGALASDRLELVVLLAVVHVLVVRAALVPSSAVRTASVGLAALSPAVCITYLEHSAAGVVGGRTPIFATLYVGIWTLVATLATTAVSAVIFGLRRQVERTAKLGQYTLDERLGEGGMGVVFRAHHVLLTRPVALKVLPPDAIGERSVARFEREVQVTSRLTHPNTVTIHDYGRTDDGIFYYVMDLVDGVTLEQLVRHEGPQSAGRVIHILRQVCGSLGEAHRRGLVHRDLKPANVMLCDRGDIPDFVKVLDFGLVRESDAAGLEESQTQVLVGTPAYLAPEAITDPDAIDLRTDIYALGCIGYWVLTACQVFEARGLIEMCSHHLYTAPEPPSQIAEGVGADLDEVILACLQKNPDSRPRDTDALDSLLSGCSAAAEWDAAQARAYWQARRKERPATAPYDGRLGIDLSRRPTRRPPRA